MSTDYVYRTNKNIHVIKLHRSKQMKDQREDRYCLKCFNFYDGMPASKLPPELLTGGGIAYPDAKKDKTKNNKDLYIDCGTFDDEEINNLETKPAKLIITVDGREYTLPLTKNVKVEVEKPHKYKTGFERVTKGEKYYTLFSGYHEEVCNSSDTIQYFSGDYVNNESLNEAREISLGIHNMLAQWQAENDEPVDWNVYSDEYSKHSVKYYISCDYSAIEPNLFIQKAGFFRDAWVVYFTTEEIAKQALQIFYHKLMWYYSEYLPRLDMKPIMNKPIWVKSSQALIEDEEVTLQNDGNSVIKTENDTT